jgi:hypothetical protein
MHDEGEEVARRGRQTDSAARVLKLVRVELERRLAEARAAGDEEQLRHLRALLTAEPRNVAALPWASLISGRGYRGTPDSPDEERMERLIAQLPEKLATTIRLEYCWWATVEMRAARQRVTVRTHYRRLREAKDELLRRWGHIES